MTTPQRPWRHLTDEALALDIQHTRANALGTVSKSRYAALQSRITSLQCEQVLRDIDKERRIRAAQFDDEPAAMVVGSAEWLAEVQRQQSEYQTWLRTLCQDMNYRATDPYGIRQQDVIALSEERDRIAASEPTAESVRQHPHYWISGSGHERARRVQCAHAYNLTDSCPVCANEDMPALVNKLRQATHDFVQGYSSATGRLNVPVAPPEQTIPDGLTDAGLSADQVAEAHRRAKDETVHRIDDHPGMTGDRQEPPIVVERRRMQAGNLHRDVEFPKSKLDQGSKLQDPLPPLARKRGPNEHDLENPFA